MSELITSQRSGYWGGEPGSSELDAKVIRNGDILDSGEIRWAKLPTRSLRKIDAQKSQVFKNDIVLTTSGECGYVAHIKSEPKLVTCATNFVRLMRFDSEKVESRYVFHFMNRAQFRLSLAPFIRGTTMKNLAVTDALEHVKLPLPSFEDQRRISALLDRADAIRVKRRTSIAELNSLIQAIFFYRFGNPIENPHKFPTSRMIELVDPLRPISYGILMPGPDQASGVPYVRVVDMREGGIRLSGIRKTTEIISNTFRRSLLKSGDLLMSIRGHVGRFAIVPPELDGANITQDTARLAVIGADPIFIRECLRTPGFQRWMEKHTKGVAVQGINLSDVKLMPIITPNLNEQREFGQIALAIDKLKLSKRNSLSELDNLFASLQQRAFRGEL